MSRQETSEGPSLVHAMNAVLKDDYILGHGDVLDIDVFQAEELKRTVRINFDGHIKLPPMGRITVAGLTVSEAEDEITGKLAKYIKNPIVTIFVKEYESQKVTILGAVKNPQVYMLTGQRFLLDIISIAGGLTEEAGDVCYILRGKETIVINIRNLLYKGDTRLNIPVQPGDVINVSQGGIIFIDGSVNGPGAFPLKRPITLTQSIALAKGLKDVADRSRIRIYRDTGKEMRDIIEVDYDDILDNKVNDIFLKDKDIVVAPMSGIKDFFAKFISSFRFFIRIGENVTTGVGF